MLIIYSHNIRGFVYIMKCSICMTLFIKTKTTEDFLIKKENAEKYLCNIIDKFYNSNCRSEVLENMIWRNALIHEATLLRPLQEPNLCTKQGCSKKICNYCFHRGEVICARLQQS